MKINLGCGIEKKAGFINIDIDPRHDPDLLCDCLNLPYGDDSVDVVRAFDFLEHMPNDKRLDIIEEIYRVLKPGGEFQHFTPSTAGKGAFQDPFHLSFWNINSWFYYCPELGGPMNERYDIKANFKIVHLEDYDSGNGVIHTHGVMYAVK
jgi:SAM-dependent methyltransferase